MAGKGDRIRPFNRKKWDEGYERVFGGQSKKTSPASSESSIPPGGHPPLDEVPPTGAASEYTEAEGPNCRADRRGH